jgi:hypothetical protein
MTILDLAGTMAINKQLTRVNARFDGKYAEQIEYLTKTTGLGVSEVLRASVEYFYQTKRGAAKRALSHIGPMIGKFGSGLSDLSANHKQHLRQLLEQKHSVKPQARQRATKSSTKRAGKPT